MTDELKTKETDTEIIIKGNLELTEDFKTNKRLIVKGNIFGRGGVKYNIKARDIKALNIDAWNINARDIKALNINALDINARDIKALDINAGNINAMDIDVMDIICESRKKKSKECKTRARVYVTNKSKLERREYD